MTGDTVIVRPNEITVVSVAFLHGYNRAHIRILNEVSIIDGIVAREYNLPENLPPHTVVAVGNELNKLILPEIQQNQIVGRLSAEIQGLSPEEARDMIGVDDIVEYGSLLYGVMTLIVLQNPVAGIPLVSINGETLTTRDLAIAGRVISATPALNTRYGGSGADGKGFSETDNITVRYRTT